MVLSDMQIKDLILNPRNKNIIDYQVKLKKQHELHLTGIGLDEFIDKVDKIENEDYLEVKRKLKNKITTKAFEKVLRPKDKIISAKGGTVMYEFDGNKSKNLEPKLKEALKDLRYKGNSLETYTNTVWLDYGIWIDPMGLTLVEWEIDEQLTPEGIQKIKSDRIKIDYISVYDRLNYECDESEGKIFVNYHDIEYTAFNKIEYLILNLGIIKQKEYDTLNREIEKEYTLYRIIDDEKDCIYWQDNDNKEIIFIEEGSIIDHKFGKVPAVFNSNRFDKKSVNRWFTTYCSEALIVAKDYLNDYIDFRIYKKKMGIPRLWEFKMACRTCSGSGQIENPQYTAGTQGQQYIVCPSCNGKLHDTERNLTDIAFLDILQDGFQSNVPPFGAVTLPTDIQVQLLSELDQFEFDLAEVVWGQGSAVDKERRDTTAFEIAVRNESKIDKLRAIEKNKVVWQTSIINLIGKALFEGSFKGAYITPANQFVILTPTETRQVYLESKNADSSEPQLNKLWIDYLEAEYQSDPISLERHKIIMLLTPMFHFDLPEAWDYLTETERLIKKNMDKYVLRYETEKNENIIVAKDNPNKIQEIYNTFVSYADEQLKQNTNDTSIQQNETEQTDV